MPGAINAGFLALASNSSTVGFFSSFSATKVGSSPAKQKGMHDRHVLTFWQKKLLSCGCAQSLNTWTLKIKPQEGVQNEAFT
jgi:hypothetical protein